MTLRPGERLGDFEIIRLLGQGGMGVVYLARDERLGRQVALKVIAPDLNHDREFQERFETEARSAAAIEHPNAVPIYSAGSSDGNLYIAMRYVEGTDLREHLIESAPLSPAIAAAIVAEVGAALDAAHAAGFVHRDVKPANILLSGTPGRHTAFLTDFGLTRGVGAAQTQLTKTGQWIGTLDYVAPEQMAAGWIDARTDIYSLGCVLYEMLSGSVPFTGDEMRKLWAKANEDPKPLPWRGAGSHPLDPVIARAISRPAERRFRSAGDLGRAALAAAGTGTEAPTERSVATGAAAAGLREADAPPRRQAPRPRPAARPAARAQVPPPAGGRGKQRRSPLAAIAIVLVAILLAGGLVAAALLLTGGKHGSRTVVRRTQPLAANSEPEATTTGLEEEREERAEEERLAEEELEREAEAEETAVVGSSSNSFNGNLFSATIPAGWVHEEDESLASDGSYVGNTWSSPAGDEELKVDVSQGSSADPSESAGEIAAGLRSAGETVYSVRDGVVLGGVVGSEIAFSASTDPSERVDFFFNLGDDGYAVLGSAYDIAAARSLVGPLVASIETTE